MIQLNFGFLKNNIQQELLKLIDIFQVNVSDICERLATMSQTDMSQDDMFANNRDDPASPEHNTSSVEEELPSVSPEFE